MSALVTSRRTSASTDLVIHDFDQWSNPKDPTFAPTSICWYEHESDPGEWSDRRAAQ